MSKGFPACLGGKKKKKKVNGDEVKLLGCGRLLHTLLGMSLKDLGTWPHVRSSGAGGK